MKNSSTTIQTPHLKTPNLKSKIQNTMKVVNKNKGCERSKGADSSGSNECTSGRKENGKYNKKQKKIGAKEQKVLGPNRLVKGCPRVRITLYLDK